MQFSVKNAGDFTPLGVPKGYVNTIKQGETSAQRQSKVSAREG
jgi:hypothetical protein